MTVETTQNLHEKLDFDIYSYVHMKILKRRDPLNQDMIEKTANVFYVELLTIIKRCLTYGLGLLKFM